MNHFQSSKIAGLVKLSSFWYNTLHDIQGQIPDSILGSLIKSAEPCGFLDKANPDIFTIRYKNQSAKNQINPEIRKIIEKYLQNRLNRNISLYIDESFEEKNIESWLNPDYTFDKYIQSKTNQMAVLACEAISQLPGSSNPLFIYSKPGMGKTHLVHALVHQLKKQKKFIKSHSVSFDDFKDEFIQSLNNKTILDYKNKLRSFDILIIENIENISTTKNSIQSEFFHVFNHYFDNGKQLVFTSNEPSSSLRLSPNLKSRLLSGLPVQIQDPDDFLKHEIIKRKCKELKLNLNPGLSKKINDFNPSSIRELEAILNRFYFLKQKGIDYNKADILRDSFHELYPDTDVIQFNADAIVNEIARVYNVSIHDIKSNSRKAEFTLPRHIGMYLAVNYTDLNKCAIARFFKKSDHTTVINAEKNILRRIEKEKGFKEKLNQIVDNIRKSCV